MPLKQPAQPQTPWKHSVHVPCFPLLSWCLAHGWLGMPRVGRSLWVLPLPQLPPAMSILKSFTTDLHLTSAPPVGIFPALPAQRASLCVFVPDGLLSSDLLCPCPACVMEQFCTVVREVSTSSPTHITPSSPSGRPSWALKISVSALRLSFCLFSLAFVFVLNYQRNMKAMPLVKKDSKFLQYPSEDIVFFTTRGQS